MMSAGHSYHYLLVSKAFWYLSLPVHITSSLQEHCANNVAKMALSCRPCLAREQVCCGNETINMKCSEQCLACNNCSRNVSIFISIYFWLSWQNCGVLHIIYPLVSSLHWQLLCNRLRNKGEVLALLINKFRGRASTGRVQAELLLCSSDFSAWPSSVLAYVETGLCQGSQMASSIARAM